MTPEMLEQRSATPLAELKPRELVSDLATAPVSNDFVRSLPHHLGTRSGWFNVVSMMVLDTCWLACLSASAIGIGTFLSGDTNQLAWLVAIWGATVIAAFNFLGLYNVVMPLPAVEVRRLILTLIASAALMTAAQWTSTFNAKIDLIVLPCLAIVVCGTLPFVRQLSRRFLSRSRLWGRRVVIVGGNDRAATIVRKLSKSARLGLRPIGVLEEQELLHSSLHNDVCLGSPEKLAAVAEEFNVSMAIFVPYDLQAYDLLHLFHDSELNVNTWMVVPPTNKLPALWTEAYDLTGQPALGWQNHISSWWHRSLKRAFDLSLIALFFPFWFPIVVCISVAIKLSSGGSIFFVQERVGYRGKKFNCLKFRSMHPNAQEILELHLQAHPELKAEWERNFKLKNDPRVTWIGKFLRITSLDELPQLFNVIRGEMSLVGPRPLLEGELTRYGESYSSYVQMQPGITGLWQVSGRSNTTFSERAWNDEYYVRNWSPWYDLYILGCTIQVVLRCEGAY
jgi:Undecaprenyl-phosphate galactose phosphotransferase WbaP